MKSKVKINNSNWKKELARDFLALGSWVFFVLVVVRILILPIRWPYLNHLLIAGGLILLIDIFMKGEFETYIARGVVIVYYTSLYYGDTQYNIFAKIALAGMVLSSRQIGNDWKKIGYGVLVGLIGVGIKFIF